MIDPEHLLLHVIRPVNKSLGPLLDSVEGEQIVLGTACAETDCGRYLYELDVPPEKENLGATGIFGMEPATYDDCWLNFLAYRPDLAQKVKAWAFGLILNGAWQLHGNLYFAAAMCRIKYYRDKEPLPKTLQGQADYYKRVYNSRSGVGSAEKYKSRWNQYVGNKALWPTPIA